MSFRRIFKRYKRGNSASESRNSVSRADLPSLDIDVRNTGARPGRSNSLSALTLTSLTHMLPSPISQHGRRETNDNKGAWTHLSAFLALLHQTPLFASLAVAIDNLSWFIRVHENVINIQKEYEALQTQLEALFKDLSTHFSGNTLPAMTTSMLNLCEAIQIEIRQVYGTQDRSKISRYMQANRDLDKITACYRRIQAHLERVMLNANLNIWRTVDKQATEFQLGRLKPSMSACYDSAEANLVQRRECAANTREQVLRDLKAWKDKKDGEKVCWISGMAGTGKTTIATTLCSTLKQNHELGASFFCTGQIPACRNIKRILPTLAYQLARFSCPYQGALLQTLEEEPDVHTKVPKVQFKRMILEPLQKVIQSLPTTIVVVIDALDECDDGDGVEQVLEVILENTSNLPIKFLISSRPEYHIRERIWKSRLKTQLILHELDETVVKADITVYLRAELMLASVSFTNEQLEALVERSGALFIYAATVIRHIRGGDSLERLEAVLKAAGSSEGSASNTKGIDRLYETVLVSALKNHEDLEAFEKDRIQLVLHTVVCAQEPLTVDALAELLSLRHTQVIAALKPLWSVLYVSESNAIHRVSAIHSSFPDYIFDSNRSKQFACNARIHNGKLAELCFRRIRRNPSQFNICNLPSSFMFDEDVPGIDGRVKQAIPLDLLYACQYWAVHLSLGGNSDDRIKSLQDFLEKRLLLWMEVLNLTKRMDKGVEQLEKVITWLKSGESSKSIMWVAQDARRFVTTFATSPVSGSTPHLYVSMLSSWPDHQPVAHHYIRKTTGLVQMKGIDTTERQLGLLSLIPVGPEVRCVAYSPNGRFFAAGTDGHRILIWDAATCRMTMDPIKGHTSPVRAIVISPDGTRICSGSYDKMLYIWDSQNGQIIAGPLEGHTDKVCSVDYSPNGQWLVSGSLDGTVCIWSTDNWNQTGKFVPERNGKIFSVAFSPESNVIAAGSKSFIHLRDLSTGRRLGAPLKGHTRSVKSLAFLPNGNQLVSGSDDGTICVWNIQNGQMAFGPFQEHLHPVTNVTISPDGCLLVSSALDDTMRIWDTRTWQTRSVFRNTGVVRSMRLSPDGSHLVSGSSDGNIRIWEVQKERWEETLSNNRFEGHSGWVRSIAFSPCGSYFVSGSSDMTTCIWDLQSRYLMNSLLNGRSHRVLLVGVSVDSNYIFSASAGRIISVWDKQTGGLEYTIGPVEADGKYNARYLEDWPVAFLFDGKRVVCGSKSGRIYMWEDGMLSFLLIGHNDEVTSIAFSPHERSFASGSKDGSLMIWDANSGERLSNPLKLKGHSKRIDSLVFSSDGSKVASGSEDQTIRIWCAYTCMPIGDPFQGHTRVVRSVVFSPNGEQVASGSEDMTVRLWDIASGRSIAVFEGHTDMVLSVAFSPDGTQIASGSADRTIRLWNAPPLSTYSSDAMSARYPLGGLVCALENYSAFDWKMDENGWVRNGQYLLLWVPPDLRSVLLWQQNTGLISRQGCIELDFSNARIGDKWETCYKPFPPGSGS